MEIKNVSFNYGEKIILNDISFSIPKGQITTILGSNGCGKSTLFKVMTKNLKYKKGDILLDGENINKISLKDFAKKVAIIHQENIAPDDLKVKELILYGRAPYKNIFSKINQEDYKIVDEVMKMTDTYDLQDFFIKDLSGGLRQRVFIAMALAQKTEILLLDEPTTYLDIKYQIEILELVKKLNKENNLTVVMILHDINQAIKYSDKVIALKNGKVFASGKTEEVIHKQNIKDIFNIDVEVLDIYEKKVVLF